MNDRGDVVDRLGGGGRRPVVVLTRQNVLQYVNKVTVAEITTKEGIPNEIDIDQKPTALVVRAGGQRSHRSQAKA
jgi:mRNA-degrading endonuclease toxin of MazEF toxin-antitoxin module